VYCVEPVLYRLSAHQAMNDKAIYRGYQRCSLIDYSDGNNAFEITVCVKPRRAVFISSERNKTLIQEIAHLQDEGYWGVYVYCIMPDHLHLIVNPGYMGLDAAVKRLKGRYSVPWRKFGDKQPLWQPGFFDHCIRSAESFKDKCDYVLQNPVRAGLVMNASEYPWLGSLARR
ncbi:MAG: transposase, partial [Kiritimatiellia bacterium]